MLICDFLQNYNLLKVKCRWLLHGYMPMDIMAIHVTNASLIITQEFSVSMPNTYSGFLDQLSLDQAKLPVPKLVNYLLCNIQPKQIFYYVNLFESRSFSHFIIKQKF